VETLLFEVCDSVHDGRRNGSAESLKPPSTT
jgi:hypothetical protein